MIDQHKAIEVILHHDQRYSGHAYVFLMEALEHVINHKKGGGRTHISCGEMLHGFVEYSTKMFGMLSTTVLNEWHVETAKDVGHLVFNLVASGLLKSTSRDSIDDFDESVQLSDLVLPLARADIKRIAI